MFASERMSASHSAKILSTTLPRWLCSRMPIPEPPIFQTSSWTCFRTSSGSVPGPAEKLKMRPLALGFTVDLDGEGAAGAVVIESISEEGSAILRGRTGERPLKALPDDPRPGEDKSNAQTTHDGRRRGTSGEPGSH